MSALPPSPTSRSRTWVPTRQPQTPRTFLPPPSLRQPRTWTTERGDPQLGCALVQRIPPEVRNLIWDFVFGCDRGKETGSGWGEEGEEGEGEDEDGENGGQGEAGRRGEGTRWWAADGEGWAGRRDVGAEGGVGGLARDGEAMLVNADGSAATIGTRIPTRMRVAPAVSAAAAAVTVEDHAHPPTSPPTLAPSRTGRRRKRQSTPAHPLALLLTSRRLHAETALFAFGTHTFHLAPFNSPLPRSPLPFHALRHRASILPAVYLDALTSLSYTVDDEANAANVAGHVAGLIAGVLLLFPRLQEVVVKLKGEGLRVGVATRPLEDELGGEREVPLWTEAMLEGVVKSRAIAWQVGRKWTWSVPPLPSCPSSRRPIPPPIEVHLHQPPSRLVHLRILLLPSPSLGASSFCRRNSESGYVRLVEGAEQLDVRTGEEGGEAEGFGWEGEDGWWEGVRERKRKRDGGRWRWLDEVWGGG